MSNIYELNFIPSIEYKNYTTQNQIGFNVNINSYLLMYGKNFYENDDFDSYLSNINNALIYFKGIEYINGKVSKEDRDKYEGYKTKENVYKNTTKIERFTPRTNGYDLTIPMIKNFYKMDGEFFVNVIALFGNNYYTDEKYIQQDLKFLGYLYFPNDYIPLYNTSDYGIQINSLLKISMNLKDGIFTSVENVPTNIRTYYNSEFPIGINIMNNIILEWGFCV